MAAEIDSQSRLRGAALLAGALTVSACSSSSATGTGGPAISPPAASPSASVTTSAAGSPTLSPLSCAGYIDPSRPPEGNVPVPRRGATFVYDKVTDQTILFGGDAGQSAGQVPNNTWSWSGTSWVQLHAAWAPPCWRYGSTFAYDDATGQVVLFGGQGPPQVLAPTFAGWFKSDTWTWNGATWALRETATIPVERSWGAMAYLPAVERLVMFGGLGASNPSLGDTWLWDGRDWSQLRSGAATPPAREAATLAYDGKQLILFGGLNITGGPTPAGTYLNDTWAFDGTGWRQLHPLQQPPARADAGLVQQGPGGVVIVGGHMESTGLTTDYNDMWRWDGTNWVRLITSMPGRANRYLFMTAQDTQRGLGLLLGGKAGGIDLNDLWAWDGNGWRQLSGMS